MNRERPLLTVCIPAYNRAHLLADLLDSIFDQNFTNFNVLICEDRSPEREAINQVVRQYMDKYPDSIDYKENSKNLGYDGNIRELVSLATGTYCVFMGNDDLMCSGALSHIQSIIEREPLCGVIVRSYATFEKNPLVHEEVFRYFPEELVVKGGVGAISLGFRRSVVIPGMVFHRDSANVLFTDKFDGTLLYQLYLSGNILATRSVVFTPEIIALRRNGTPPDFGNSDAEKGKFVPLDQTPDSSIHFMRGMFEIAKCVQQSTGLKVYKNIISDVGNYSYPIIAIQSKKPKLVFLKYGFQLGVLGLWRQPLFYCYFLILLLIGSDRTDRIIRFIKYKIGRTPRLGISKKYK
ncbi:glycosyltransferase family 2 protein [Candidatus Njordibacter sp. Uisw_002]|uniref:glycosyltransferase family 2 protein n=1 Tax=Candidatus Njordibacter sp. Uisw_002 TaxID=3230971 RepID=UPI003D44F043